MGELWLKGKMDERECGWLERQMVSRHPLGQHNSMQGRSVLRVTPTPLFIAFLGLFRVLSPWLGLLAPSALSLAPFGVFSSFEGF